MRKIYNFLAICLFTISSSFSAEGQASKGEISGNVSDKQNRGIGFATISIFNAKDSIAFKTSASDRQGRFAINGLNEGQYYLEASSVGYKKYVSAIIKISLVQPSVNIGKIMLESQTTELKSIEVVGQKPFMEQKADRTVINVDASPASAGASAMDLLEKSPGVTVDKDGNISLKGKQGVMLMIDDKPTYMTAAQLAGYLKSLPASAIEVFEIMANPSSKYDAAGNSGIINIKTKKNKAKGFNGSLTLTHAQGVYPKPGGSVNLNVRTGKFNFFLNGGYTQWEGYQDLDITRQYFQQDSKHLSSIFVQHTNMKFKNPEANLKIGADYFFSAKTTIGLALKGFKNNENDKSYSYINLEGPNGSINSKLYSPSTNNSLWKNGAVNFNIRHQFDSTGTELTADADYIKYRSESSQYFTNIGQDVFGNPIDTSILKGDLPSNIDIYSFKSDFSHSFKNKIKFEAGIKTSHVTTDNIAGYYNVVNHVDETDTGKTNRFVYHENINAAYISLNRQIKNFSIQAGLRMENTNYSGHQFGNSFTVISKDSSFKKSYINIFPTLYASYQANEKNIFSINYGRRIDRPAYEDLNPFMFFLDQYTYQAGNPYLRPQYTHNIELSHTYNNFFTTTINYSITKNFFTETFEQAPVVKQGDTAYATIVRNGNIGQRQNAGVSVSAQLHVKKWWTAVVYANMNYNQFKGPLYGEDINVSSATFMANLNNQFRFAKGWGGEISGWYRTRGVEGQIIIEPMGQAAASISKQLLKDKASLKMSVRDMFYTQQVKGYINFQQTAATFHNARDSRQVSLTFVYRFGKPIKGAQPQRNTGGANDEQSRVKSGGNN